jgi:hypothetical protein
LCKEDERTISQIEKFGCSVVTVKGAQYGLGWSYTVGIYDTSGQPEIITVGLFDKTARFVLNRSADLLRNNVDLTHGRHSALLNELDCEFRAVDPKWVTHLMNRAVWYYDGADFPVLQAVYPDRENRFPGDPGFDKAFEQPLMQPDAPMTRSEDDFWASTDPKSSLFDWKFQDSPHANAFVSEKVYIGAEQITFVSHDADDGAWQFLGDSMFEGSGLAICLHHLIDRDRTLVELADLPLGWYAERRQPGEPWIRSQREPDETSE